MRRCRAVVSGADQADFIMVLAAMVGIIIIIGMPPHIIIIGIPAFIIAIIR
jgi:hypothetical protein